MPEDAGAVEARPHGSVTVRRAEIAGPVLNRVLATAAAQAELPLDRVSDVLLLGDELVARGPAGRDGALRVEVQVGEGRLDLRVGPLEAGAGQRVLDGAAVTGLGNLLDRLADDVHAEQTDEGDALVFVVAARPA